MKINQLKAGAVLSYLILGLNNLVGLVYTPYMLRMMGQSEFGLYSLVTSVIAYLTILDLGFGNTIIRYTAKFRAENKSEELHSMFGMFVTLYMAISLITILLGSVLYFNIDLIYSKALTADELQKVHIMIILLIFNLAFTFPLSIFGSIITAYENFVFQRLIRIARIILNTGVMIILLEMGYRAIGMVVLITLLNLITLLLNFWYCKAKLKIKIRFKGFDRSLFKELAGYSFFIFLGALVDRLYWSSGQIILGAVIGTAAVAIFSVAIQLQQMYSSFSTAIPGVFLPKITALTTKEHSHQEISDLFIKTGRIQFIILAFVLTGFILFGEQFITLWAGPDYKETYYITLLFFIPMTIPLIQNIGLTILMARNQMKFRSVLYVFIAAFSVLLQLLLVKRYGGIGSAIAICTALVLGQIIAMNIYYYKKQNIDIPKFWKEIGRMAVSPVFTGVVTYFILQTVELNNVAKLAAGMVVFSVVYLPLFWFTSMNAYEKQLLVKPIQKVKEKVFKR